MKKFAKLAAVLAALMLALSCFVACSNGADDDSTPATSGNQTGGNNQGGSGNAITAKTLQGVWIDKDDSETWGFYFVDDTVYNVQYASGKYYYIEDHPMSFSVSENKIVDEEGDEVSFKINGNTMTMSISGKSFTLKKVNITPTKITASELEELERQDVTNNNPVKALQGLWIDKEESYIWGWYFVNNTMYQVQYVDGTYYYIKDYPMSFSVSENKIVDEEGDEMPFTINGNTMTMGISGKSFTLKKVNITPTKITYSELEELERQDSSLQGLWIYEGEGYYFVGSTMYVAGCIDGEYYYYVEYPMSFSVSGNEIVFDIDGDAYELPFKINGNTLTLTISGESVPLQKVNVTPTEWKEDVK